MSDEQEVVKEGEIFWGKLFCTNGDTRREREMIGKGMTSEG